MKLQAATKATLLTLAFAGSACAKADAEPNAILPPRPERTVTPLPARLVPAENKVVKAEGVSITGRTRANRESSVATARAGRVDQVKFQVGDYVEAGAIMVRLDAAQVNLAVDSAKAALRTAEAHAAGALRERKRLEKVGPQGAVPVADVERATTAHEVAQAQVAQAAAGLALAQRSVTESVIRAPFSGLVLERSADEGEWLNTMAGGVIARVADVDPLEIALQAPEHLLTEISVGDEMQVRFSATGQTATAKVRRVVRAVDPMTRSFEVVAEVPNSDRKLAPGLFAEARLVKGSAQ